MEYVYDLQLISALLRGLTSALTKASHVDAGFKLRWSKRDHRNFYLLNVGAIVTRGTTVHVQGACQPAQVMISVSSPPGLSPNFGPGPMVASYPGLDPRRMPCLFCKGPSSLSNNLQAMCNCTRNAKFPVKPIHFQLTKGTNFNKFREVEPLTARGTAILTSLLM